ncbi:hypothetical protein ACFQH2_02170 [Natronoarchaeum sp. GCM10025703]|uniref:hypothetical protein n=1 Tax=Natronoarchaeum sp. GCM10025703 TaxID=3252685 RepID=UPI0036164081
MRRDQAGVRRRPRTVACGRASDDCCSKTFRSSDRSSEAAASVLSALRRSVWSRPKAWTVSTALSAASVRASR